VRRVPFRVRLKVPVGDVVERSGWLVEGAAGWGEFSPLPSWSEDERDAAERAAIEAASEEFPKRLRDLVEVNALIPRVDPSTAARMAVDSGCRSIKIKVGDADGEARVRAVREALPDARIRVDANGSWDLDTAAMALPQLVPYDIELCEDPVAQLEDMAQLRRGSSVLLAAESSIRTIEDARLLRRLGAADLLVVKPQRIGGVRAALQAAEEAGVPAIASSALETSVGLAAVLATAAALPDAPFAHGVGTALLLEDDVVTEPLLPVNGVLIPRRPIVAEAALHA
jgi:o-succinylbenzoate synthase